LRVTFDSMDLRLKGSLEGLDRNEKHHERQPAFYFPPSDSNSKSSSSSLSESLRRREPGAASSDQQVASTPTESQSSSGDNAVDTSRVALKLKYQWDTYLETFSGYALHEPFHQDRYQRDVDFEEVDYVFLNSGRWNRSLDL
jgi:hypothetical protein